MNRIWILVTCFVAFGWTSHEEYPNVLWKISVIDEETLETVKGVTVIREIYYEYAHCQPQFSPKHQLYLISGILKRPGLTNERIEELKKDYKVAERAFERSKQLNKIPVTDTIPLNRYLYDAPPGLFLAHYPTLSYKVTISHPDYQSVALSKEYEYCEFYVSICVELKRK